MGPTVSTGPAPAVEDLLAFFRVLSERSRLAIVALLMERPRVVEELAEAVRISPATCSHHLRRLEAIGLVRHVADGPYRRYSLVPERLTALRRSILSDAAMRAAARPEDLGGPVLRDFVDPGGRLISIPAQRKKRAVIVDWLAERFEPGRRYDEREVNAILGAVHADVATLRRELVAFHRLGRENGVYWRTSPPPPPDAVPADAPASTDRPSPGAARG
jgi:DNA-binding HxlR family transcriptional regulator